MNIINPEIETERLLLRAFTPADFEAFAAMRADAEVMRFIGMPVGPHTREQARAWQERNTRRWQDNGFGMWAVVEKATGELAGWCGLSRLDETQEVEVGYGLARRAWGRGLATEAARASLRYGFERMGLTRLVAVVNPANHASRHVIEKLGLRYVKDAYHYGADLNYFEINRAEFKPTATPYVLRETPANG
ncbi:MAG TPA: GNAT family N-acetyltransferase [Pyrinomonadaceae bacterium]